MSFSLNYSKCEIIVGLFLLNLFGYGKVKMLGGFITKKNPQNSACKCNHSFLMVLSMVVEIILEIIFLCWKLQVYNSKFPTLLRNGYLYMYKLWKSERRHICWTNSIHCSFSLQLYSFYTSCHNYKRNCNQNSE